MSRFDAMDGRPIFLSWHTLAQEEHGAIPKKVKFDREAFETLICLIGGAAKDAFWKFYNGNPHPTEMAVKLKSGQGLLFTKQGTTHLGIFLQDVFRMPPKIVEESGLVITWQALRELVGFAEGLIPAMEKDSIKIEFEYGSLWIEMGQEVVPDTVNLMGETR